MASPRDRLETLIPMNPKVNPSSLKKATELMEHLRRHGLPAPRYDIAKPGDKRRPSRSDAPRKYRQNP